MKKEIPCVVTSWLAKLSLFPLEFISFSPELQNVSKQHITTIIPTTLPVTIIFFRFSIISLLLLRYKLTLFIIAKTLSSFHLRVFLLICYIFSPSLASSISSSLWPTPSSKRTRNTACAKLTDVYERLSFALASSSNISNRLFKISFVK